MSRYYDICIIGGGILGSFVAKNCAKQFKGARIALLEAEDTLLSHNSARNSGVLHTGFYYGEGTMKAEMAVKGSKAMKEYCEEHDIEINNCGKLVIPTSEQEHVIIKQLYEQGLANGVNVELVDAEKMKEIEPLAKANDSFRYALYAPDAAVSSIDGILSSVRRELRQFDNLEINTGTVFKKKGNQYIDSDEIITNKGNIEAKIIINVSGHDCLRVAQQFGLANEYQMFPLRGFYLKANCQKLEENGFRYPKTLLYPVPPEKSALFLGSHTTPTTDGYFKVGPTAIPGLSGRHFTTFSKFSLAEAARTLQLAGSLLLHKDFGYYWKMLRQQQSLMKAQNNIDSLASFADINPTANFTDQFEWSNGGVRTLVFNKYTKQLEKDFIVKEKDRSIHVINYASPGWTSAISMADYITDRIVI